MPQVVARLWWAACAGDHMSVRMLLLRHRVRANIRHPVTSSSLLLDVAAVQTRDICKDIDLAHVMRELIHHGASVWEMVSPANNTPMHVLAAQPKSCSIHHRMVCLFEAISNDRDSEFCVLELRNEQGLRPQEVARARG